MKDYMMVECALLCLQRLSWSFVFYYFIHNSFTVNCCNFAGDPSQTDGLRIPMCVCQGALDWHPAPKPVLEAAIEARERAAKHGVDIGTLAIKHAVKADGVITLVGMRTPEEVSLRG